jgi:alkanesulfonate monooxygenase SsuD/methylene tetrahydromethanopterin reductase-like flavin-dependent oxidoreductase (luciferase family)
MQIDFGIFDHIEALGDLSTEALYEQRIAMLKEADAAGFYAYHLAEHHGHGLSMAPSQLLFLAALARETTQLRLIPSVMCLPLHHPIRLAEEICMLDALSGGRLELGIGKGISPFEHLFFGHDPEEASARTKEVLRLVIAGLTTGRISSDGSPFFDFPEIEIPMRPVQSPYPPLWSAGNPENAGRGGHNFLFPMAISDQVREMYFDLRAASRETPGHLNPHVTDPKLGSVQTVIIGDTDHEAIQTGRRVWNAIVERLKKAHGLVPPHLQLDDSIPAEDPFIGRMMAVDPIETQMVVAGTVETVRDYFVTQTRRGLANYFVLSNPVGDMTYEETMYILRTFIAEVVPAVREAEVVAYAGS